MIGYFPRGKSGSLQPPMSGNTIKVASITTPLSRPRVRRTISFIDFFIFFAPPVRFTAAVRFVCPYFSSALPVFHLSSAYFTPRGRFVADTFRLPVHFDTPAVRATDETTSHSTRLSNNDNQVAGYQCARFSLGLQFISHQQSIPYLKLVFLLR